MNNTLIGTGKIIYSYKYRMINTNCFVILSWVFGKITFNGENLFTMQVRVVILT